MVENHRHKTSPGPAPNSGPLFVGETLTPLTLVEAGPDAVVSQLTRSAPLYGKHFWRKDAFLKRLNWWKRGIITNRRG
jgi:hypothetical protein